MHKVVISTHVNYTKALTILLHDLHVVHTDWNEVVIVVAGSEKDLIVQDPRGFTVIEVTNNFYELSAIYGVAKYIDHGIFKDVTRFLMIQDTIQIRRGFPTMKARFIKEMELMDADVYYASADRKCNIAALSRKFIEGHGLKYGITAKKDLAWAAEHNGDYSFSKFAEESNMKVVDAPWDSLWLPGLINYPDSEIKRCMVYFAALDMFKLVATCDETINPPADERCSP
jgi:hypothetical protein